MKQQTLAEGVKAWATAVVKAQHKITTTDEASHIEMSCTCGWSAKCLTPDEATQWVAGHESTFAIV
jgi:hypothetical protein